MTGGWSNQAITLLIVTDVPGFSGVFIYNGLPGPGTLIGSWTAIAGTDPYGNSYVAGFEIQSGLQKLIIDVMGGTPAINLVTGLASISVSTAVDAFVRGTSPEQFDLAQMIGAKDSTQLDQAGVAVTSSSPDGTTQNAQGIFYYIDATNTLHIYQTTDFRGVIINAGALHAPTPGTGTRATPATSESWHAMTLAAGFTAAPAPFATPRYRLECEGGAKTVRLSGAVELTAGSGASETFWTAPAAYTPSFGQHYVIATKTAAGANATNDVNVTNAGNVELINTMLTNDVFYLDGLTYVLD